MFSSLLGHCHQTTSLKHAPQSEEHLLVCSKNQQLTIFLTHLSHPELLRKEFLARTDNYVTQQGRSKR